MRTKAEIPISNTDKMREVLLDLFPGRDVCVKFRTREHRELSGYWVWDLTQLSHTLTPIRKIMDSRTKSELLDYRCSIIYRTIRWRDVIRKYTEIKDREQRDYR